MSKANSDIERTPESIKPYADHTGDGLVQLSFCLPVAHSSMARRAAIRLVEKMGLEKPDIVHCVGIERNMTYFVVYGRCQHVIESAELRRTDVDFEYKSQREVERIIARDLMREVVVVGASTGTDTHSVGIDTILNMKGYDGHYGLERYTGITAYNMGSQVANEALVARAIEVQADAILVSQTVTQQNLHLQNLSQLVDIVEAEGLRERIILICGGARITNELAKELGYDAGFSKGCYPNHVASFIVDELCKRSGKERPPHGPH